MKSVEYLQPFIPWFQVAILGGNYEKEVHEAIDPSQLPPFIKVLHCALHGGCNRKLASA